MGELKATSNGWQDEASKLAFSFVGGAVFVLLRAGVARFSIGAAGPGAEPGAAAGVDPAVGRDTNCHAPVVAAMGACQAHF